MQDQNTPPSVATKPSLSSPEFWLTAKDLAAVSGFPQRRLDDLRCKTLRDAGKVGPDFFLEYNARNIRQAFYTPEAVRAWLTVKRPSKLPLLDAWLAARTSTTEV